MGPNGNTTIHRARIAKLQPRRLSPPADFSLEDGDIVVSFEVAGIWRSGPGLTAPTTQTLPEYRVAVHGQTDVAEHLFEMYDLAVADAETLAADRKVRVFYLEKDALTLLKDYRPGPVL